MTGTPESPSGSKSGISKTRARLVKNVGQRLRRALEGHALSLQTEANRLREHSIRLKDLAEDYEFAAEALEKEIVTLHGFLEEGRAKQMGTDFLKARKDP